MNRRKICRSAGSTGRPLWVYQVRAANSVQMMRMARNAMVKNARMKVIDRCFRRPELLVGWRHLAGKFAGRGPDGGQRAQANSPTTDVEIRALPECRAARVFAATACSSFHP